MPAVSWRRLRRKTACEIFWRMYNLGSSSGAGLVCRHVAGRNEIKKRYMIAGVAQLVERNLAKVEVESSRLFSRSRFKKGRFKFSTWPSFFIFNACSREDCSSRCAWQLERAQLCG
jgi:hypothetical protein